jgi:hypothetical protein
MSSTFESPQPPDILGQLLEPVGRMMPLEFARELVALRATPEVQSRIDELADRCNEGICSESEKEEYQSYVQAIHLIGLLQAKARRVLRSSDPRG